VYRSIAEKKNSYPISAPTAQERRRSTCCPENLQKAAQLKDPGEERKVSSPDAPSKRMSPTCRAPSSHHPVFMRGRLRDVTRGTGEGWDREARPDDANRKQSGKRGKKWERTITWVYRGEIRERERRHHFRPVLVAFLSIYPNPRVETKGGT